MAKNKLDTLADKLVAPNTPLDWFFTTFSGKILPNQPSIGLFENAQRRVHLFVEKTMLGETVVQVIPSDEEFRRTVPDRHKDDLGYVSNGKAKVNGGRIQGLVQKKVIGHEGGELGIFNKVLREILPPDKPLEGHDQLNGTYAHAAEFCLDPSEDLLELTKQGLGASFPFNNTPLTRLEGESLKAIAVRPRIFGQVVRQAHRENMLVLQGKLGIREENRGLLIYTPRWEEPASSQDFTADRVALFIDLSKRPSSAIMTSLERADKRRFIRRI